LGKNSPQSAGWAKSVEKSEKFFVDKGLVCMDLAIAVAVGGFAGIQVAYFEGTYGCVIADLADFAD